MGMGARERVAVVLSGAVARGAFQAGALAAVVPALERQGLTPTIWLGTSAGGMNAVAWVSEAHRGAQAAADRVVNVWEHSDKGDIYRPLLLTASRTATAFAAGAVLGVGSGTTALLDTAPLHITAGHQLHAEQAATNVDDGVVSALGVVATRMPTDSGNAPVGASSGRSVLFLHQCPHASPVTTSRGADPDDAPRDATLEVVPTRVDADHVLASSAFPVAFPPVRVTIPETAAGWYLDGGLRLNTPLSPAIALGATRIVVISATAIAPPPAHPGPDPTTRTPRMDDAAAQLLDAVLTERTIEDLARLRHTNRWVANAAVADLPGLVNDRTGLPYRLVEVMTVSPPPGALGALAADVLARTGYGAALLREIDNLVINRVLRGGGDGIGHRELLSYLLFDREYFTESIRIGRRAGADALAKGWQH
jgi:NTE family protein